MEDHDVHGCIIAAFLGEMAGLVGQATSEGVESKFSMARCIRQGRVEALPALAEHGHADPGELGNSMGKDKNGRHVGSWWTKHFEQICSFLCGQTTTGSCLIERPTWNR